MVEATKARVAPVSSAMLYGRGVFTTLAIYDSKPFLWSNHWQRLSTHAEKLDIDLSGCTAKSVGEALQKLINVNQVKQGRARVIFLSRTGRESWRTKAAGAKRALPLAVSIAAHSPLMDSIQADWKAQALVHLQSYVQTK